MLSYSVVSVLAVVISASLASIIRPPLQAGHERTVHSPSTQDELLTQVSLQYHGNHQCGASILSPEWVLTSAQCVAAFSQSDLSILSGANKLNHKRRTHQLGRVISHQDFSFMTALNDIAVLQISPPLSIDENQKAVKLPVQDQLTATNSTATMISWTDSSVGDELKKMTVLVMDHQQCANVYSDFFYHVSNTEICVNVPGGKKDECYGEAGSPLFVEGEMVGLASWSDGCAVSGTPSVFTRMSSYRTWIKEQTGI